jgi:hypothetical protein
MRASGEILPPDFKKITGDQEIRSSGDQQKITRSRAHKLTRLID